MEVRFRVANGQNAGQIVPVAGPKFFLGRAEDCQLRPRSNTVSRYHCALLFESGCVLVRDLGSKNGTFVNDQRVRTEVELKNGDRLRVGELEFEVQMTTELGAKKRPAVRSVQEAALRSTTIPEPLSEDDGKLDDWLAGSDNQSNTQTASLDYVPEDVLDGQTVEELSEQEATKSDNPAPAEPDAKQSPSAEKGPGFWNRKPPADNTVDAAGEALKQFFRGR